MKLIWLQLFNVQENDAYSLCICEDLYSFGYFQRSTVREHLIFASRTSSSRCPKGNHITITLKEVPYKCHVYRRNDGLCGIVISDNEYPERVAHTLISKMLNDFDKCYNIQEWKLINKDSNDKFESFSNNQLTKYIKDYQDPKNNDQLLKIQQNLDEIKDIMHKNLEDVLRRGETLDTLLQKSEDIGEVSKMFHTKAKKTGQCCQWF
jgi:synaptobrevin family protein YKT6